MKLIQEGIDIIIANIGPHYNGTDLAAIRLLDSLQNVSTFIGGGYVHSTPEDKSLSVALDLLHERGFKVVDKMICVKAYRGIPEYGGYLVTSLAFKAERNPPEIKSISLN